MSVDFENFNTHTCACDSNTNLYIIIVFLFIISKYHFLNIQINSIKYTFCGLTDNENFSNKINKQMQSLCE